MEQRIELMEILYLGGGCANPCLKIQPATIWLAIEEVNFIIYEIRLVDHTRPQKNLQWPGVLLQKKYKQSKVFWEKAIMNIFQKFLQLWIKRWPGMASTITVLKGKRE